MARPATTAGGAETSAATLALTALTITTAAGYCRVFDGWDFFPKMVIVALACHAVAAGLRAVRAPLVLALPLGLVALVETVALLHYRDTLAGPFPGPETFDFARLDLTLVWDQFPTAVAPVPSSGGYAVGAALALGIAALAADAFAFRAFGRAEAAVPTGVLMVFTAALGIDRNRVGLAALWVAAALCCVALLRLAHGRTEGAWLGRPTRALARAAPAAVVLAAAIAGIAAAAGPRLPGAGDAALVDTRNRSGDVTAVVSPLVDIRSRLVNQSEVEYFTVSSALPSYWRLTGLAVFNGSTWALPSRPLVDIRGRFADPDPGDVEILQTVVVKAMGGQLVPAAFKPVFTRSADELQWVADTATLVRAGSDGLSSEQRFDIVSAVGEPPVDVLRTSTASSPPDPVYLELPRRFPDDVVEIAREVTAGASTPYEKALALQDWFRSEFTYNIDVQRGHSVDSIESFLRLREGYCEQFAGAFAAMARALGLPARVAVGFTPGDLQADGAYHVRGRNAHAWPEVWFDEAGWVLFEPTPGRGAPGAEATTGVAAAQEPTFDGVGGGGDAGGGGGGGGGGSPTEANPTPQTTLPSANQSTLPTGLDDLGIPDLGFELDGAVPTGVVDDGGGGGASPLLVGLGAVALAAVGWLAFAPFLVGLVASRRATRRPDGRIVRAWRQAVAATALLGVDHRPGDTPIEHASNARITDAASVAALDELARHATRAIYAPTDPDEATAQKCESLARQLRRSVLAELSWTRRLRARVDPRLAAQLQGIEPAL